MSFRIEEKLYIKYEHLIDFKQFLIKRLAKQLYQPRLIKSLYFDNLNFDMYNDSIEGVVPRKKIRIREYPSGDDKNFYLEIIKKLLIIKKQGFLTANTEPVYLIFM
jgi:SPX domain protein involved in polyphosphate accumulation